MAVGQGAIRLEIVPALESSGLTPAADRRQFPAVATLDAQWVHILNDMTPMIGAMSDNVANYQADREPSALPALPVVLRPPRRPGRRAWLVAGESPASGPRSRGVSAPLAPASSSRRSVMTRRLLALAVRVGPALGPLVWAPVRPARPGRRHALVGMFKLPPGAASARGHGDLLPDDLPQRERGDRQVLRQPRLDVPRTRRTPWPCRACSGGLVTGKYQPNPTPAFNAQGGALADQIVQPQSFTAIDFSIATNKTDPQTGTIRAPAGHIVDNGKLSGQVEAWSAAWNKLTSTRAHPSPAAHVPG